MKERLTQFFSPEKVASFTTLAALVVKANADCQWVCTPDSTPSTFSPMNYSPEQTPGLSATAISLIVTGSLVATAACCLACFCCVRHCIKSTEQALSK